MRSTGNSNPVMILSVGGAKGYSDHRSSVPEPLVHDATSGERNDLTDLFTELNYT